MRKSITNINIWSALFLISLIIEILMLSYFKNLFGIYISPIVIILNNFALIFFAFKVKNKSVKINLPIKNNKVVLFSIFLFIVLATALKLNTVFQNIEISPAVSDVIPTLQKYNTRLFSGEFPYNPIQYDGWKVIPNYLPMQWLPFSIAEFLEFDYRWIAFFAFVSVLFFYWKQNIDKNLFFENILKIILPFVFIMLLDKKDNMLYGTNVELLLVAYYMFLAFTIKSKNYILVALGILVCLLSRFSLLFWLPLYGLLILKKENFSFALKVGISVFAGVLFIYIIPFLSYDPYIFTNGLKYYSKAAVGEWLIKSFQTEGDIPFHLGQGIGFAVYFYKFAGGLLKENLNLAKYFHVFISIVTVLISLAFYYFKKPKMALWFFILLSFKLYLSVFYAFIHIPYLYLQQVPLFISIAILYELNLFQTKETKA